MKAICWHGKEDVLNENGKIDPSFVVTHRVSLAETPAAYATFRDKSDGCVKVVIKPDQRI